MRPFLVFSVFCLILIPLFVHFQPLRFFRYTFGLFVLFSPASIEINIIARFLLKLACLVSRVSRVPDPSSRLARHPLQKSCRRTGEMAPYLAHPDKMASSCTRMASNASNMLALLQHTPSHHPHLALCSLSLIHPYKYPSFRIRYLHQFSCLSSSSLTFFTQTHGHVG